MENENDVQKDLRKNMEEEESREGETDKKKKRWKENTNTEEEEEEEKRRRRRKRRMSVDYKKTVLYLWKQRQTEQTSEDATAKRSGGCSICCSRHCSQDSTCSILGVPEGNTDTQHEHCSLQTRSLPRSFGTGRRLQLCCCTAGCRQTEHQTYYEKTHHVITVRM
jgi:hypothetical protein